MKHARAIAVIACMALLSPAIVRSWSFASGPQGTVTLFESHRHPDLPLDRFAAGRLGLIKRSWADSYKFVAYRYLLGIGFDPAEQKALVAMWYERLGLGPLGEAPGAQHVAQTSYGVNTATARDVAEALSQWFAARNQMPGVETMDRIDVYRSATTYFPPGTFQSTFYFPNCNGSAFRTATRTLQAMIDKFGLNSPEVHRWLAAQDEVFVNCSGAQPHFVFDVNAWFKAVDGWNQARKKIPGVGLPPSVSNGCKRQAFQSATSTLEDMIGKLGATSPQLKQWVDAQDQTFVKCSQPAPRRALGGPTPAPTPDIPPPLAQGTPFEQAQRAYQIACANFYAGNYDTAAQMFDAMGADRSSPWHEWGPYLAARATIRKATLTGAKNDLALLAQAKARLKAIIAASADEQVKSAAARLLSFVEFRLGPEQRVEEVEHALMQPHSAQTLAQNLTDYDRMFGNSTKNADGFFADDLTDWLASFNEFYGSMDRALSQWKKTASLPWLVAAISQVAGSDSNATALLDAAGKVKPDSPAYVTVTFQAARLLAEQGKPDEARTKLDTLLAMRDSLPTSTVNEIKRLRMRTARNLDELLTDAARTPLGVTDTGDGDELPSNLEVPWLRGSPLKELVAGPLFDSDSAEVLSRWLPLSVEQRAAQSPILPERLRAQVALAAWTRAVLLGDNAAARELAPVAGNLIPQLKPSLDAWLSAKNAQSRNFDAAYIMLTHPGMRPYLDAGVGRAAAIDRIDSFRDNWWRFPRSYDDSTGRGRHLPPSTYPLFLSTAQSKAADDEWARLSKINAPNFMCSAAIGQARRVPDDERVPEALYQCITAVHLGCSNAQGTDYARAAFSLLHRSRYADSPWAQTSRFWYRGDDCMPAS